MVSLWYPYLHVSCFLLCSIHTYMLLVSYLGISNVSMILSETISGLHTSNYAKWFPITCITINIGLIFDTFSRALVSFITGR